METIEITSLDFVNGAESPVSGIHDSVKDHDHDHDDQQASERSGSDKTDRDSSSHGNLCLRQKWSTNEDQLLGELVKTHGTNYWPSIAQLLPGRNGKQW